MNKYWLLTRLMTKNLLLGMNPFTKAAGSGKDKVKSIVRGLFILIMIAAALASVVYVEYVIHKALRTVGQRMLLPGLAVLIAMVSTLVLGLFQGISELYQGKDAPWLAVLPFTSRQIFMAKMTTLYLSEQLINLVIITPAFVLYCLGQSAWPMLALRGLIVALLVPLIPLSVMALLSSLLMRIGAFARHRDTVVMILSMALALAYSISITYFSNTIPDENASSFFIQLLLSREGLLNALLNAFPPALWAVHGFIGSWSELALFSLVSIACIAAVVLLCGGAYLDQTLQQSEATASSKARKGSANWKPQSTVRALMRLEWRELLRTPAWAMNGLFGVVMFPLMFVIGFMAGTSRVEGGISTLSEDLSSLIAGVHPGYPIVILAAAMCVASMVNPVLSTAISREGGRYPFAITLPVPQKKRFTAKLLVGMEINVLCTLMILLVGEMMFRFPLWVALAAFALSLLISFAAAAASLAVDALHPSLKWVNEMQAIKSNFNQVFGMILWVVLVALCVVVSVLLWDKGGLAVVLGVTAVALAETLIAWFVLMRLAASKSYLPENID